MKKNKNIVFGIVMLSFFLFLQFSFAKENKEEKDFSSQVRIQEVSYREQKDLSEFGGFVLPLYQSDIASLLSARVEEIYVSPGQYVRRGDPLLRLDATRVSLENESAQAQYEGLNEEKEKSMDYYNSLVSEAEKFLDKAKKETSLTQEGSSERVIAQKNEDIAKASLQSARKLRDYNKESLEKGVNLSKIDQSLTKEYVSESIIRASRDGKVSTLFIEEGAFARAGESLVRVSSVEQSLRIHIPSSQAYKLSLGDSTEISSQEKGSEEKFLAPIVKIDSPSTVRSSTYTITLSLPENEEIYEGMYVWAHIETGETSEGILLDRSALHSFYYDHFVFIVSEENRIEKKKVSIIKEYTEEVLLEGVSEGDRVVIASDKDLLVGMTTQIYE